MDIATRHLNIRPKTRNHVWPGYALVFLSATVLSAVLSRYLVFKVRQRTPPPGGIFSNNVLASFLDSQAARQQAEQAAADAAALRINPHFLSNTLGAIRALCLTDPDEAARCMDLLAAHMSAVAHAPGGGALIPVSEELDHAGDYLALREAVSAGRVRWRIDEGPEGFRVPPLCVLTLVENAVDHGVLPTEGGGTVTVATREADGCYEVVVADDGAGFSAAAGFPSSTGFSASADKGGPCLRPGSQPDPPPCPQPAEQRTSREHLGIPNTRLRVERIGGSLELASEPGRGTRATIRIPKRVARAHRKGDRP